MMKRKKINSDIERRIDLYVNNQLDRRQIESLWADLIQDESALDYLKTVANLSQLAEAETRTNHGGARILKHQEPKPEWRTRYIAAAAALVIMAGSFGLFTRDSAEAVEPISSIELDYYRSSDGGADRVTNESVIREAIILANQGNHQQAIHLLEEELSRSSDPDTRALLFINAGSILYNASLYEEAAAQFEEVVDLEESDSLVRERAYWYLGNTYFQMNRIEYAREAFQEAYELNGAYSRVAQSYLRALAS